MGIFLSCKTIKVETFVFVLFSVAHGGFCIFQRIYFCSDFLEPSR